MKLNQKTFFYSTLLAVILVLFFLIYMVVFLPNLYVDHVKNQNIELSKDLHFSFLEERSYDHLKPISVQNSLSLVLPKDEDQLYFYSKLWTGEVVFKDKEYRSLLQKIKEYFEDPKGDFPIESQEIKKISDGLLKDLPLSITTKDTGIKYEDYYQGEEMKVVRLGRNTVLISMVTRGQEATYSVIFLLTTGEDEFVITLSPVVNPKVGDILPVALNSLPMVLVLLFLVVLLGSTLYSRFLVDPVMKLASHTRDLKERSPMDYYPLEVKGKDEVAELSQSLNELQETIQRQYSALEQQAKTQTVLLRAGSHQLKTPVAASLLLVDGMIQEVGKYKDVKAHLPQLRNQLQAMQQIISALLEMNRPLPLETRKTNLHDLVEQALAKTRSLFEEKEIRLINDTKELQGEFPELFDWILQILVENALVHTKRGESLRIWNEGKVLHLLNTGSQLPEEDVDHLFTPFVKGRDSSGHGLGLYLASYYAENLGWSIGIHNVPSGVDVWVDFSKPHLHFIQAPQS